MPSIDCWRLLGISSDASVEDVRTAFARRAKDVHPDSGGTGDGLTMSLLIDAREDALGRIELRDQAKRLPASPSGQSTSSTASPPSSKRKKASGLPKGRRYPCYVCNQ